MKRHEFALLVTVIAEVFLMLFLIRAGNPGTSATYSGRSHQALGTSWERIDHWLGIPAVVLSAFLAGGAGVTALVGADSWITATLALVAAGLTGARTFLRPDDRADLHGLKGDGLISLRNDALLFQDVDLRSDAGSSRGSRTSLESGERAAPSFVRFRVCRGRSTGIHRFRQPICRPTEGLRAAGSGQPTGA